MVGTLGSLPFNLLQIQVTNGDAVPALRAANRHRHLLLHRDRGKSPIAAAYETAAPLDRPRCTRRSVAELEAETDSPRCRAPEFNDEVAVPPRRV